VQASEAIRALALTDKTLVMKYTILLFVALLYLPVSVRGQPNRESEIEELTEQVYSTTEFRRVADSLQLSVTELSCYPVISPIRNPHISSDFGKRKHPIYKRQKFHTGIDFAEAKGTPVYATGGGVVVRKGYNSGYGNFIEIRHAGGFRSFYAHLSRTLVNAGDSVRMGKYIACVGNSGLTTGYHLHYEIRKGNRFLNPTEWCCCLIEVLKSDVAI
jgi:murein DD-endopeptidase MepM/ murein hydrolase activator NlpD